VRIYRREGSKIWWAQWRNRRQSLGTTDREAAELAFRQLQRRSSDPTYRAPDPAATLTRELDAFIARQKERGRSPDTIEMYELHARTLTSVLGGSTPIAEIDAAAIERYVSTRTRAGASKSYRWKELCTLRGCLKRSRRNGTYPWALDQVMPDDLQPEYVPLTRHLMLADVAALLAELPLRRRAVVAFIVATGSDLGSVWRATATDFQPHAIRVRGTKNAKRDRIVPILALMKALAEEARQGVPFEPWASMRRDLARACGRAGTAVVTARDLRRSTGRILRAAGVQPSLIGPILGHAAGSRVTAQTYAQIEPAELGAQIDRVTSQSVTPGDVTAGGARKRGRGRAA
jgi:integrase